MLNVLTEKQVEEVVESRPVGSATEVKRMEAWLKERLNKGAKGPYAEVTTLTPVLASLLLQRNIGNRQIGPHNAEQIKADLLSGRWCFNGESIVISETGVLLDGQHRCSAVVETRVSIPVVLVFGPKEESRFTIDIGRPKSAANFLGMKGYRDTPSLASAISLVIEYGKTGTIAPSFKRPTKTEIVTAADELRGIQASLDAVQGCTRVRLGSRGVFAFCHYTFKRRGSKEDADEFMRLLIEGDGLRKGDPIFHCRDRLLKMESTARQSSRAETIFRGWNMWRRGETVNPSQGLRTYGQFPKVER
jgi:hypothetical protein